MLRRASRVGVVADSDAIVPVSGPALPGSSAVRVRVRGEHTNGVLAVIEETLRPGVLVPPHVHANDVWVKVEEGEIGLLVGDEIRTAGEGDWALKPREVRHAMWNATLQPARITEVLTPAGSERWFEELAALADEDDVGFLQACERHGIRFLDDKTLTTRLKHDFGLE